jgi:hypothetical protein
MTTIIVDDEVQWTQLPPIPGFVPPTIRQLLAGPLDPRADCYVCEGKPMMLWAEMDYAEDWSTYPIREVHPFHPVLHGKQISEAEFRTLVKAMHCIS